MKRILSLFIAVILLLPTFSVNAAVDGYTIEHDTEFTFKVTTGNPYSENFFKIYNSGSVPTPELDFSMESGDVIYIWQMTNNVIPQTEEYRGKVTLCFACREGTPIGEYTDRLIITDTATGEKTYSNISCTVSRSVYEVNVYISNVSKYIGDPDPEFTYTVKCIDSNYAPIISGTTLVREEGEAVGSYKITMPDAKLESAESNEYADYVLRVINGKLTVMNTPEVDVSSITVDGHFDSRYSNNAPVTVTPSEASGYDLISFDRSDWQTELTVNEEGKTNNKYTFYLKDSKTGKQGYTEARIRFDYVTQDDCSFEYDESNQYTLTLTMKNLAVVKYTWGDVWIDELVKGDEYTRNGKLPYGINTMIYYAEDIDGRNVEYTFDNLISHHTYSLRQYIDNENYETVSVTMPYGSEFTLPEDYKVPEGMKLVAWKHNDIVLPVNFSVTGDNVNIRVLIPILAYCIPEGLMDYTPPEYLEHSDLADIKAAIKKVGEFKGDPNYELMTDEDKAVLADYEDMLYGVLSTVERVYRDVKDKDWYASAVNYCFSQDIMTGVGDHHFAPQTELNRAMFAIILWNMEGKPAPKGSSYYTDVRDGSWFTEAVNWAHESGIVAGIGNGRFNPSGKLTREQLAAMMYRYTEYKGRKVTLRADLSGYADENKISDWAYESMSWSVAKKLISGRTETTLVPKGTATRAETAQIIYNYKR